MIEYPEWKKKIIVRNKNKTVTYYGVDKMKTIEEIKNGSWKMRVTAKEYRAVEKCIIENVNWTMSRKTVSPFILIYKMEMYNMTEGYSQRFEDQSFIEITASEFLRTFCDGKFKMRVTFQENQAVQERFFQIGGMWFSGGKNVSVSGINETYLFIDKSVLTHSQNIQDFENSFYSEIKPEHWLELFPKEITEVYIGKLRERSQKAIENLVETRCMAGIESTQINLEDPVKEPEFFDFKKEQCLFRAEGKNKDDMLSILFYLGFKWGTNHSYRKDSDTYLAIMNGKIFSYPDEKYWKTQIPFSKMIDVDKFSSDFIEYMDSDSAAPQKKLDVKFTRDGATVTAEILYQDESLRNIGISGMEIVKERNGYFIMSNAYPQIEAKHLWIYGNAKNNEKRMVSNIFEDTAKAIRWLENIKAIINEINFGQPGLKHATVNETLNCYRTKDKYSLEKSYWYCLVDGGEAPKHKHESYDIAAEEAERLEKLTGKDVEILQAVGIVWHEYTNIEKCVLIARAKEKGGCAPTMDYIDYFLDNNPMSKLTVDFIMKNLTSGDIEWAVDNIGLRLPSIKHKDPLKLCPECNVFCCAENTKCSVCDHVFDDMPF